MTIPGIEEDNTDNRLMRKLEKPEFIPVVPSAESNVDPRHLPKYIVRNDAWRDYVSELFYNSKTSRTAIIEVRIIDFGSGKRIPTW